MVLWLFQICPKVMKRFVLASDTRIWVSDPKIGVLCVFELPVVYVDSRDIEIYFFQIITGG